MRLLILGVVAALAANGQGTVPTTGTWTAITGVGGWTSGSTATTVGYDKLEYVSSRKLHCVFGSSRINGQSEPNNANICFNYAEKRWEVLSISPMWANSHNSNNGHSAYGYVYMPGRDALAYYTGDGSGNLVYQPFKMDWWWFDVGGLSGQQRQLDSAPWLPNGTPLGHGSVYDPINDKIIIWPAYSPSAVMSTAVIDVPTGVITLYSSAQTGTQPAQTDFISMAWNTVTSKAYVTGGLSQSIYAWDTPTHQWTLLSPSGTPPPARKWAGLACSTIDGGICLFAGGVNGAASSAFTDTWIFNPSGPSWTQQSTAANYSNSVGNAIFQKVSYDADSNVFLLVQSNGTNVYAFPYSTALGYGRTSNSYSPTAGSLNRSTPGATQSWAYGPSLAVNGSTIAAAWIESFANTDTTSCANGSFHPYVQTTPNSGTWTGLPAASQATACAAMDSEASSATIAGSIKTAYVGSTLWAAWSKYSPSGGSVKQSAFAKSWTGSAWSGGPIGCFLIAGTCTAGDYQDIAAIGANGTTPVAAVIEWTTGQFVPEGYGYVAQYSAGTWSLIGAKLNLNSVGSGTRITSVALASDGTNPAACWIEERRGTGSRQAVLVTPPQISCAQWNGSSSWVRFGSSALNINAGTYARDPAMTYVGGKFYISWTERTLAGVSKLYLCRWDTTTCTMLGGGALNIDTSTGWAAHPQVANDGTNVYLSWDEQTALGQKAQGHVVKWNGSTISALGGAIAADTTNGSVEDVSLAVVSGAPTVMWGELKFGNLRQVYAQQFNGTAWAAIGASSVAPTITTTTLPGGTTGTAYSQTLAATGSPAVSSWLVVSGSLPAGLSLASSTGVISGNPTFIGTASFTVQASNGVAPNATQALTITITGGTITPGANTLTITNTGSTTTNYPVQIGRAFLQGEIPSGSSPRAAVNNVSVNTQVDVKNNWPDGSLKYAIISFLIPTFTTSTTYTISFVAGATVGNTALTQGQMQAAGFDFDAVISLTNGATTRTASARTMLNNGDYTVWASGPIATTIILAHHAQGFACPAGVASGAGSVSSKYDFGMNTHCAFRPIFQATFWAGTNQVFVRYIGEVANTEQYEDVTTTSMSLSIGSASPTTWYTKSSPPKMNAGTRWTKTRWLGGTPPAGAINHNLAYLASTYALPNYDTTRAVSGAVITSLYSNWTSATKDIYNKGVWDSTLGAGGGHTHVAPYPQWTVQYLYTGDIRMQEIAIGQAELLSSVEWHFREGKTGKKLDRAGAVNGIGYPLSISNRPSINTYDLTIGNTADKVVATGAVTLNNLWGSGSPNSFGYWGDPISHPPEIWFPTYLLTGDYFFLEEGQFQAAFMASVTGGFATGDWRSRGPTGAEGGIIDRANQRFQTRGQSWAVRSRAEMAWISPDADPFKAYLTTLLNDNLAMWEGQRYITGTPYQGTTMWNFGQTTATANIGNTGTQWDLYEDAVGGNKTTPSPLHFWDNGNAVSCDTSNTIQVVDTTVTHGCASPWFDDYMLYALGRTAELGYAAGPLRDWLGPNKIGALTDAGYNPFLAGAYRSTVTSSASGWPYFTTWAAAKAGYLVTSVPDVSMGVSPAPVQAETDFVPGIIFSGCQSDATANCQPLVAALSMVANLTNGAAAWSFVSTNILPSISGNPMWAILPRSIGSTPSGTASGGLFGGRVSANQVIMH